MNPALRFGAVALLLGSMAGCERQPDVLVLFVDTLRHDRLGCTAEVGKLPQLEPFLTEGTCFDRVASTSGWTLPSETSMLFSAYPEEHRVEHRHSELAPGAVSLAAPLQAEGYTAALFSGNILTSHPQYQPHLDHLWVIAKTEEFADDVDAQVVDEALRWMDEDLEGGPLALVLQLYGPHYPYCPPGVDDGWVEVPELDEGEIDLCDPAHADLLRAAEEIDPVPANLRQRVEELYDLDVAATNDEVARFLDGWGERRSRSRLTVVVTDHGEAFGEHGNFLHGRSLHYETSDCHMAFHGEGVPAQVVDRPVELLDLAPTLASQLDVAPSPLWRGLDLSPLFTDPDRAFEARTYQTSSLFDTTQLAVSIEGDDGHRYRLLAWDDGRDPELYDRTADPTETEDLAGDPAHADLLAELEVLLDEMQATAGTGGPPRSL